MRAPPNQNSSRRLNSSSRLVNKDCALIKHNNKKSIKQKRKRKQQEMVLMAIVFIMKKKLCFHHAQQLSFQIPILSIWFSQLQNHVSEKKLLTKCLPLMLDNKFKKHCICT